MAPPTRRRRGAARDKLYVPRRSPRSPRERHPLGLPVWHGMLVWPLTERERRAEAKRKARRVAATGMA